jgi:hypothetical protein
MTTVDIDGGDVVITLSDLDTVLSIAHHLRIPLERITTVRVDDGDATEDLTTLGAGLKAVGTRVPGWVAMGRFLIDGHLAFLDVRAHQPALALDLDHEKYNRVVVAVEDPEAAIRLIEQAQARPRPARPA